MIQFEVVGFPAPGGSKRAFLHGGRVLVVDDARRNRSWRAEVASQVASEMHRRGLGPLLNGPLSVEMTFYVPHPRGHFGTGRNAGTLRQGAPRFPAVRPDLLKLARSTEDALTGVLWGDDAQIVRETLVKEYRAVPGCRISVEPTG